MNILNYYIFRRTTGLLYTAEFVVDLAVLFLVLYFRVTKGDRESLPVYLLGGFYNSLIECLAQGSRTRMITETRLFRLIPVGYPFLPLIMGFFEGGILILIGYHLVKWFLNRDGRSGRIAGVLTAAMAALAGAGALLMNAELARRPGSLIVTRRALFSPGTLILLSLCFLGSWFYFFRRKGADARGRRGLLVWCAGLPLVSAIWYTPLFIFGTRFVETALGGSFSRVGLGLQIMLLYGYSVIFEAAGFYLPVFIILQRRFFVPDRTPDRNALPSGPRRGALNRYILGGILLCAVLALLSSRPATPRGVAVHEDIAYLPDKEPSHRLDLYLPREKKNFPVLVFVHGGGWRRGDKSGSLGAYARLGGALAREGIGAVIINYRLAPLVSYREQARDVAAALRWTDENISRYGGDRMGIFLGGHSAGAHLALLAALDSAYRSPPIRGIIFWSGIADISSALETSPEPLRKGMYEAAFGDDPREWRRASPINYLSRLDTPLLIIYGDKNFPQIRRQARLLLEKAREFKLPVTCRVIAGRSHLTEVSSFPSKKSAARKAIVDFIRSIK